MNQPTSGKFPHSCAVIYYEPGDRDQNGETLKGRNVLRLSRAIFDVVETFSTARWKKNPFRAFLRMKRAIKNKDFVFLVVSSNGALYLGKYLVRYARKHHSKVFYFMVGIGPIKNEIKERQGNLPPDFKSITKYFQTPSMWLKSSSSFSKVFPEFDHAFVESPTLKAVTERIYGARNVSVLVNFRENRSFSQGKWKPHAHTRLVYFARIAREKGIFDLLSVADSLAKEGLRFQLDIYGSLQVPLEELSSAIHSEQIRYRGVVTEEQTAVLSEYDALVFPTKSYEGMPGTVVESLLAGTPAIVSNYTFATDMIREGENGFIYPFDDTSALKEALRSVIIDPDKLHGMRAAAKRSGKRYLESSSKDVLIREIIDSK